MPLFVDGKDRRAVRNPIFPCQIRRPLRYAVAVPSVTHIKNFALRIFGKFCPDICIIYAVFMQFHCLFIIYSVHQQMGMTFAKHNHQLPPCILNLKRP